MKKIKRIGIRRILSSTGGEAYEAEVELEGGNIGVASSSVAIVPGKREKRTTGKHFLYDPINEMENCFFNQSTLDSYLESQMDILGSDITLSVSLAFARASCSAWTLTLVEYLQSLLESKKGNQYIVPLVPLFSGGIHDVQLGGSMQQIMIGVSGLDFRETVYVICSVYQKVEHFLIEKNLFKGLAASSGFLVKSLSIENEFAFIRKIIDESEWNNHLFLAVDVAAEHLRVNGNYRFYNQIYSPDEFEELLYSFIKKYSILLWKIHFIIVMLEIGIRCISGHGTEQKFYRMITVPLRYSIWIVTSWMGRL